MAFTKLLCDSALLCAKNLSPAFTKLPPGDFVLSLYKAMFGPIFFSHEIMMPQTIEVSNVFKVLQIGLKNFNPYLTAESSS